MDVQSVQAMNASVYAIWIEKAEATWQAKYVILLALVLEFGMYSDVIGTTKNLQVVSAWLIFPLGSQGVW